MKADFEVIDYCENTISIDTLTNKTVSNYVMIKSGNRVITIGVNTLVALADFLREKGLRI